MEKYGLSVEADIRCEFDIANHTAMVLYQCVRELLFNVLKHAGVDKALVRASRVRNGIEISVIDDGVGITSDNLDMTPRSGSRFGLFTIQERMQNLGGTLTLNSAANKGTQCTLTVPAAPQNERETANTPRRPTETFCPKRERATVLIVDDHPAVRRGLRQRIELHPSLDVVEEAKDGLEAIEKARTLRPDVVIMDLNMPIMDGIEATRRILSEMPETCVVGLSIRDDERAQREMMAAGAVGLVNKGQPLELLFELLESVCIRAEVHHET